VKIVARRGPNEARPPRRSPDANARSVQGLCETEERLRSLTELSSDYYWETDAAHRLVRTQHGRYHRPVNAAADRFGRCRWERPSTFPDAAGWTAHRELLERHESFRDFEFARIDDEGHERWLSISGEPTFDAERRFTGYRGVGKDVTARKHEEKLLVLEHTVTRRLADANDRASGLLAVLRSICETKGWECGRFFRRDEDDVFRFDEAWHVAGASALERFVAYSRGKTFARGVGVVGRAGAGETVWTPDIGRDPRMVSRAMVDDHGMRGALMFPALSEGQVVGVLSFTSREIREPDERLLRTTGVIGSLVGQFLRRKQAEEVLRESEERFRMLTKASSDWYWEQDAELRFVTMGSAIVSKTGISAAGYIGKRRWDLPAPNMTEADWAAHRGVCEAHLPFHDLELCRLADDGRPSWVLVSGEPVFDAAGSFRGYRGVGKDITARKRAEQLRELEHSVTRALAAANSVSEVLRAAIRAVCESEGWDCGRYFAPSPNPGAKSDELRMADAWGVDDEAVRRFIERSHELSYAPGAGLAGQVWRSGEAMWVADISRDPRVLQRDLALETGVRGAFVFPVIADGRTIGVLAFISRAVREPEEALLQAIRVIGIQIGQFVQRKQAEELREREQQVLALEHAINRCLAKADGIPAAIEESLRTICEFQGWECGRYYAADEKAQQLRCVDAWGIADAAVQRYLEISRANPVPLERGLKGRAWRTGEPQWASDTARHEHLAKKILGGSRDTFIFPVIAGGRTIGLLSFTNREVREPDARLLQAARVIGSQFGQFLQRKQAEQVVRESEERFRSLSKLSSDVYWEQDAEFRFTSIAGAGCERLSGGLPPLGTKAWEHDYVNMTADDWLRHIERVQVQQPFRDLELCRADGQGGRIWISISGEPVFDAAGRFRGYRGVGKDITPRKVDEERIQYLATHDPLTSLPNRAMFGQLLTLSIRNARRYARTFAVLFVDLDRFKVINDTLGHEAGDQLLQQVAERLSGTVRASDVVARLGGDEFVVLVQEVSEAHQAETVARKLLAAFARPLYIAGQEYRITASIGISMFPSDAEDEQTLMKNADIAMYRAKEEGKNTCKFYSAKSNSHSFERLALETSLRRGLDRGEFSLHYQAKVDLRHGGITGVEALLRWQHPELGMVPPGQFIPLAEETGLIVPLGKWVLRAACEQSVAWRKAGLPPVRMSVNISGRQFADEHLLEDIAEALAASGLEPSLLELELTESMVMQSAERAATVLAAIKKMGVRLAIDDFGVGYSSLAQLKRLPIDTLKVDRSFIRDIPQDADDSAIAEAIIAMGKRLHLTVVAEGVETREQQAFLEAHDCDEMQGFYFSRPIPAADFGELLRKSAQVL
jgi:diguanylate cyclase (GGDEF)-like protein/PAS domain S-box-containing protein